MLMMSQTSNTKILTMKEKEKKKEFSVQRSGQKYLLIKQGTMSLLCLVKLSQKC